ncbi:hypothetical protein [Salinarimonas sp.]|uniref:hypothetical protein n=1 Tax=Salinarimonas sp. TaxID=2766526 RepID=UPI0032D99A0B
MNVIDLAARSRPADEAGQTLSRLRAVVAGLDLGCDCKARLDGALTRFSDLEEKRARRQALVEGRDARERIGLLLALLAELDDVPLAEPDASVYRELKLLFRDVAAAAERGARAMAGVGEAARS